MKDNLNTNLICASCGKQKNSARPRIDPILKEVFGKTESVVLCIECYHKSI